MNFRYVLILSLAIVVTTFAVTAQPNASPAVISAVAPVYPPIARTANATGDATVEVVIDRDGKVTQVESKSGHPIFRKVAEEAARRWLFETATTNQRKATLTFLFRLLPAKSLSYDGTAIYYPPYKIEARALEAIVNP